MSTGPGGAGVALRGERRSRGSRFLFRRFADERLVALLGRGNEVAFEELFDRHSEGVLSYCSHILGSENDGQDAVQHAFLAVWQAVVERGMEPRAFNSWLYTIARNRCVSVLRSRREAALEWEEEKVPARESTIERVEQRADVRELLGDLRTLPEGQRTALLLSELGDLSHVEIASVLGCPREKVKSLVFQARSSLARTSEARQTPCLEVREELAGSPQSRLPLALRRHLKGCGGCAEFATEIRRQRQLIAIALPVAVGPSLKGSVFAAVGVGGQIGVGKGGLVAGLATKGALISGGGVGSGGLAGGGLATALATNTGLATAVGAGLAVVTLAGAGAVMERPAPDQDRSDSSSASERPRAAAGKPAFSLPAAGAYDDPARPAQPPHFQSPPEPGASAAGPAARNGSSSGVGVAPGQTTSRPAGSPGQGAGAAAQRGEPLSGVVPGGQRSTSPRAEGRSPRHGAGGGSQRGEPNSPSRDSQAQRRASGRERQAASGPPVRHPTDLARAPARASDEMRECLAILREDPRRELRCAKKLRAGGSELADPSPEQRPSPRRTPERRRQPGPP
ncbi:MAG TPA: sigma-70 family RNA polymerase sigma factor [Solirubrobacteraceae bacterium]|nr:sigma-70 family RNA polymerase sigma factor [Solirubrobacteraceae bacterium]